MSILSVDLGTSNTVAVLAAHGRLRVVEVDGSPVLPSAVFAAEDGLLVVGREAERRARLDPARFEPNPKRRVDEGTLLLGDRVVPVSEAFAAVLAKVGDEVSRQLGGARPDEVRLTHPAQWGPVRRNVLLSAARQVGLGARLILVPEPVAAAAHFASFPGRSLAPGQGLAVYDLGAGTFDVAVVSGSVVLAESGLPDLGGLDVDQALLSHVGRQVSGRDPGGWQRLLRPVSTVDRRAQRVLREDVRAAKESLSSHPQTEVPLPEPFGDVLVTRAELEALIRPNLLRSVELLDATVRSAGLSRDQIAGVYLVGGSSRIPLVATLIAEQLRIVPTNLDQPETAVALGAHHVAPEGTSLRTENLGAALPAVADPNERTTSIAPPPRSAGPRRTTPSTNAPPPANPAATSLPVPPSYPHRELTVPGHRKRMKTPWVIATAVAAVLVLVGVLIGVLGNNGGGRPAATQETPRTEADPTTISSTTPTATTTDLNDVVVNHPKQATRDTDCSGLVTANEVSSALAVSVSPIDSPADGSCGFSANYPGQQPGSVYIRFSSSGLLTTKIDYEGNTAYQDDEPKDTIDTEGGGGSAPQCEVSLAVSDADFVVWLRISVTIYHNDTTTDLCAAVWSLTKIAFDKLPDA